MRVVVGLDSSRRNPPLDALVWHPRYPAALRRVLERLDEGAVERRVLAKINEYAVVCVEQMIEYMQFAEEQQLEKIRSICEVALDDMSKLPAAVKNMRPLLDQDFIAYLDYAIDKEREGIRGRNLNPDLEPTEWLQILGIIKNGVYAELGKGLKEDIKVRAPHVSHWLANHPCPRLAPVRGSIARTSLTFVARPPRSIAPARLSCMSSGCPMRRLNGTYSR